MNYFKIILREKFFKKKKLFELKNENTNYNIKLIFYFSLNFQLNIFLNLFY